MSAQCPRDVRLSALQRVFLVLGALLFFAACSPAAATPTAAPATAPTSPATQSAPTTAPKPAVTPPPGAATATGDITVFAAASLTDVFNAIAMAFQQANPDAQVTLNFASSGTLVTQLGQGAKADAFASADQNTMNNARAAGAVVGPDQIFASNSLIVITPKANPAHIAMLMDLANPGIKVVTADTSVPIGNYTQNMLQKASADPTYGSDFQAKVTANVVSQQTDDRQIVSQVVLGEADAGVVYATDITPQTRDQLNFFPVPGPLNTVVVYPIAVTRGDNQTGGQAFVNFVLSSAGQAVLATWNFLPPPAAT